MKKIIVLLIPALCMTLFLSSCQEGEGIFGGKDKPCVQAKLESIPAAITEAQASKFPESTVTSWFDNGKDGFCVHFKSHGKDAVAAYSKSGELLKTQFTGTQKLDGDENEDEGNDDGDDDGEEDDDEGEDGDCGCDFDDEE
jgi:hypothetical protein